MNEYPNFSRSLNEADGKSMVSWASAVGNNNPVGNIYGSLYGSYLGMNKDKVPYYVRWTFCLEHLLEDAIGVSLFKNYLQSENCSNALDFWFACQGFRTKVDKNDQKKIKVLIKAIFRTFIRPENHEKFYAKIIKNETIKKICEKIKGKIDINQTIFNQAQAEVEEYLRNTAYPRFLKSNTYLDYLETCKTTFYFDTQKVYPPDSKEFRKAKQYKIIEENMQISRFIETELPIFENDDVYQNILENSKNPEVMLIPGESGVISPPDVKFQSIMPELPINPYAITSYQPQLNLSEYPKPMHKEVKENSNHKERIIIASEEVCTATKRTISFRHSHPQNMTSEKHDQHVNDSGVSKSAGPLTTSVSARVPYQNIGGRTLGLTNQLVNCKQANKQVNDEKTLCQPDASKSKAENLAETNPDLFFELVSQKIHEQKDNFAAIRKAAKSLIERNRQEENKKDDEQASRMTANNKQINNKGAKPKNALLQTAWADRLIREAQSESDNPQEAQAILEDHCSRIWERTSNGTPNDASYPYAEMSLSTNAQSPQAVGRSDVVDAASEKIIMELLDSAKNSHGHSKNSRKTKGRSSGRMTMNTKAVRNNDRPDNHKDLENAFVSEVLKQTSSTCAMGIQSISTRYNHNKSHRHLVQSSVGGNGGGGENSLAISIQNQRSCEQSTSTTVSTSSSSKSGSLIVGYYLGDDPVPYRSQWPHSSMTLNQFKQLIPKKGKFRYFFKRASDEFDTGGVVQEEITDDESVLPLWDGKIVAKVERIN